MNLSIMTETQALITIIICLSSLLVCSIIMLIIDSKVIRLLKEEIKKLKQMIAS